MRGAVFYLDQAGQFFLGQDHGGLKLPEEDDLNKMKRKSI